MYIRMKGNPTTLTSCMCWERLRQMTSRQIISSLVRSLAALKEAEERGGTNGSELCVIQRGVSRAQSSALKKKTRGYLITICWPNKFALWFFTEGSKHTD